jgi:hypothetical protein
VPVDRLPGRIDVLDHQRVHLRGVVGQARRGEGDRYIQLAFDGVVAVQKELETHSVGLLGLFCQLQLPLRREQLQLNARGIHQLSAQVVGAIGRGPFGPGPGRRDRDQRRRVGGIGGHPVALGQHHVAVDARVPEHHQRVAHGHVGRLEVGPCDFVVDASLPGEVDAPGVQRIFQSRKRFFLHVVAGETQRNQTEKQQEKGLHQ